MEVRISDFNESADIKFYRVCFNHPWKLTYLYQKSDFMAIYRGSNCLPTGTLVQEGDHPWPWVSERINKGEEGEKGSPSWGNGLGQGPQVENRRKNEKL